MNNSYSLVSSLIQSAGKIPEAARYWISYSGGLDSTVLLHLFSENKSEFNAEILAVHVNHQINKQSDNWAIHCENFCKSIGIPIKQIIINAKQPSNIGPEAFARKLRYDSIQKIMNKNDVLFTAHHQDDLAETLLLQLLRGSGPEGLAGMPKIRKFGKGWLARPLLDFKREELAAYAGDNKLKWIDDESNMNLDLDRNYIRNKVMKCLEHRWPAAKKTIARSAELQSDVIDILTEIGEVDFRKIKLDSHDKLKLSEIKKLSDVRKKNLLRYWLKLNGYPVPSKTVMERILSELIEARKDASPLVSWEGTEIRRYRNQLLVMKSSQKKLKDNFTWHLEEPLDLDWCRLMAVQTKGKGIRASSVSNNSLNVRFRTGGEKISPIGRKETHKLKKLFQDAAIPPWQRKKIPLLYIDDQLAAVPGYWIETKFNAGNSEPGWEITLVEY